MVLHTYTPRFVRRLLAEGFQCLGVWDHDQRANLNAQMVVKLSSVDELLQLDA